MHSEASLRYFCVVMVYKMLFSGPIFQLGLGHWTRLGPGLSWCLAGCLDPCPARPAYHHHPLSSLQSVFFSLSRVICAQCQPGSGAGARLSLLTQPGPVTRISLIFYPADSGARMRLQAAPGAPRDQPR